LDQHFFREGNLDLIQDFSQILWFLHLNIGELGGACRGKKLIGRNPVNLIVRWCGRFLFFVVPRQFSQDIGE